MNVFGTMFSDISASLFRRPATQQYPLKRTDAPLKLRGMLHIKLGLVRVAVCAPWIAQRMPSK